MEKIIYTICLLLFVNGCMPATYWYQEGKTMDETYKDFTQCAYEATQGSYTPYGWGLSPGSAGMQQGMQQNRLRFMCMYARGYKRIYYQLDEGRRTHEVANNIYLVTDN